MDPKQEAANSRGKPTGTFRVITENEKSGRFATNPAKAQPPLKKESRWSDLSHKILSGVEQIKATAGQTFANQFKKSKPADGKPTAGADSKAPTSESAKSRFLNRLNLLRLLHYPGRGTEKDNLYASRKIQMKHAEDSRRKMNKEPAYVEGFGDGYAEDMIQSMKESATEESKEWVEKQNQLAREKAERAKREGPNVMSKEDKRALSDQRASVDYGGLRVPKENGKTH